MQHQSDRAAGSWGGDTLLRITGDGTQPRHKFHCPPAKAWTPYPSCADLHRKPDDGHRDRHRQPLHVNANPNVELCCDESAATFRAAHT